MRRLFASALFLTDADYAYLATQITYGVCIYRCAQGVQKVIAFGRRALDPPVVAICMLISSKTASILNARLSRLFFALCWVRQRHFTFSSIVNLWGRQGLIKERTGKALLGCELWEASFAQRVSPRVASQPPFAIVKAYT
jgi:hypothetical protein